MSSSQRRRTVAHAPVIIRSPNDQNMVLRIWIGDIVEDKIDDFIQRFDLGEQSFEPIFAHVKNMLAKDSPKSKAATTSSPRAQSPPKSRTPIQREMNDPDIYAVAQQPMTVSTPYTAAAVRRQPSDDDEEHVYNRARAYSQSRTHGPPEESLSWSPIQPLQPSYNEINISSNHSVSDIGRSRPSSANGGNNKPRSRSLSPSSLSGSRTGRLSASDRLYADAEKIRKRKEEMGVRLQMQEDQQIQEASYLRNVAHSPTRAQFIADRVRRQRQSNQSFIDFFYGEQMRWDKGRQKSWEQQRKEKKEKEEAQEAIGFTGKPELLTRDHMRFPIDQTQGDVVQRLYNPHHFHRQNQTHREELYRNQYNEMVAHHVPSINPNSRKLAEQWRRKLQQEHDQLVQRQSRSRERSRERSGDRSPASYRNNSRPSSASARATTAPSTATSQQRQHQQHQHHQQHQMMRSPSPSGPLFTPGSRLGSSSMSPLPPPSAASASGSQWASLVAADRPAWLSTTAASVDRSTFPSQLDTTPGCYLWQGDTADIRAAREPRDAFELSLQLQSTNSGDGSTTTPPREADAEAEPSSQPHDDGESDEDDNSAALNMELIAQLRAHDAESTPSSSHSHNDNNDGDGNDHTDRVPPSQQLSAGNASGSGSGSGRGRATRPALHIDGPMLQATSVHTNVAHTPMYVQPTTQFWSSSQSTTGTTTTAATGTAASRLRTFSHASLGSGAHYDYRDFADARATSPSIFRPQDLLMSAASSPRAAAGSPRGRGGSSLGSVGGGGRGPVTPRSTPATLFSAANSIASPSYRLHRPSSLLQPPDQQLAPPSAASLASSLTAKRLAQQPTNRFTEYAKHAPVAAVHERLFQEAEVRRLRDEVGGGNATGLELTFTPKIGRPPREQRAAARSLSASSSPQRRRHRSRSRPSDADGEGKGHDEGDEDVEEYDEDEDEDDVPDLAALAKLSPKKTVFERLAQGIRSSRSIVNRIADGHDLVASASASASASAAGSTTGGAGAAAAASTIHRPPTIIRSQQDIDDTVARLHAVAHIQSYEREKEREDARQTREREWKPPRLSLLRSEHMVQAKRRAALTQIFELLLIDVERRRATVPRRRRQRQRQEAPPVRAPAPAAAPAPAPAPAPVPAPAPAQVAVPVRGPMAMPRRPMAVDDSTSDHGTVALDNEPFAHDDDFDDDGEGDDDATATGRHRPATRHVHDAGRRLNAAFDDDEDDLEAALAAIAAAEAADAAEAAEAAAAAALNGGHGDEDDDEDEDDEDDEYNDDDPDAEFDEDVEKARSDKLLHIGLADAHAVPNARPELIEALGIILRDLRDEFRQLSLENRGDYRLRDEPHLTAATHRYQQQQQPSDELKEGDEDEDGHGDDDGDDDGDRDRRRRRRRRRSRRRSIYPGYSYAFDHLYVSERYFVGRAMEMFEQRIFLPTVSAALLAWQPAADHEKSSSSSSAAAAPLDPTIFTGRPFLLANQRHGSAARPHRHLPIEQLLLHYKDHYQRNLEERRARLIAEEMKEATFKPALIADYERTRRAAAAAHKRAIARDSLPSLPLNIDVPREGAAAGDAATRPTARGSTYSASPTRRRHEVDPADSSPFRFPPEVFEHNNRSSSSGYTHRRPRARSAGAAVR